MMPTLARDPYDNLRHLVEQLECSSYAKHLDYLRSLVREGQLLIDILEALPEGEHLSTVANECQRFADAKRQVEAHKHGPMIKKNFGDDLNITMCVVCGEDLGWFCPKSETKLCEYNDDEDPAHDHCLHCGHPEERK